MKVNSRKCQDYEFVSFIASENSVKDSNLLNNLVLIKENLGFIFRYVSFVVTVVRKT